MHRSGTSVVSRLLNLLGVHLGPGEALMRAADDNPKGFWEHHPLVMINDEILARFGGGWDAPPAFPPMWPRHHDFEDLKSRARTILAGEFGSTPLWGFKDPRSSITLPFWQEVVGPMRYVICLRAPNAVVASLARRNGMDPGRAERLWLAYVHASLVHTRNQPRLLVFYDDVLDDWRTELRKLAAFIGLPGRAEDPDVQRAASDFLEHDLRHHDGAAALVATDRRLSAGTTGLYLSLRGHGRRTVPPAAASCDREPLDEALELCAARSLEAWDASAALSAERERLSAERERLFAERERLFAEREQLSAEGERLSCQLQALAAQNQALAASQAAARDTIASLEATLAGLSCERDDLNARLRVLQEENATLARSRQELSARASEARQSIALLASDLEHTARDRDRYRNESLEAARTLREIRTSSAWRLVTASRGAIVRYLPAESRRRRVFNGLLRRISNRLPAPADGPAT
ncbi:MAG: hypothetical protein AB7Q16_06980 [Vicinamibacterales bacterium]